jgi:hypothetical protein
MLQYEFTVVFYFIFDGGRRCKDSISYIQDLRLQVLYLRTFVQTALLLNSCCFIRDGSPARNDGYFNVVPHEGVGLQSWIRFAPPF